MAVVNRVESNTYYDSIKLMRLSESLSARDGVQRASVVMGTDANKRTLADTGLLAEAGEAAGPNDLVIAVDAESDEAAADALSQVETMLAERAGTDGSAAETARPPTLERAQQHLAGANLALISVPGSYAALEAAKALNAGLHVFLFSDNVSVEEERDLKEWAVRRDRLMMGPDCGTAIVNGIALAFANVVRRGSIGLVAASGTGLQEVTCLLHRGGAGVSQAIGVGGRDLSAEIGGLMTRQGLNVLAEDPETDVIVLISKPPADDVAQDVLDAARAIVKPVVVNFLGYSQAKQEDGLTLVTTLEAAAEAALRAARVQPEDRSFTRDDAELDRPAQAERRRLAPGQEYLRGLFSGGTLCDEAMVLLAERVPAVYSNIPLRPEWRLEDAGRSREHSCIDLGDDEFTQGRPHPMLDPRLRQERLMQEADDPSVAVLLLDVVTGYGSHADPAGALAETIRTARARAAEQDRYLAVVCHVCGTEQDPQDLTRQEEVLRDAGALVFPTNAQAARVAAAIVRSD